MAQVFATPGSSPNDGIVYPDLTGRYIPVLDAPAVDGLGLTNPWGAGSMSAMTGQSSGGSVVGSDVPAPSLTSISGSSLSYNVEGLVGPQGPQGPKGDPGSITTVKQQVFVPYGNTDLDTVLSQIRDTWENGDTLLYASGSNIFWNRPWDALDVKAGVSSWNDASAGSDGEFLGIASDDGLFTSTDGGTNWTETDPGTETYSVIRVAGTSGQAVAVGDTSKGSGDLWTSTDSGTNWAAKAVEADGSTGTLCSHTYGSYSGVTSLPATFSLYTITGEGLSADYAEITSVVVELYTGSAGGAYTMKASMVDPDGNPTDYAYANITLVNGVAQQVTFTFSPAVNAKIYSSYFRVYVAVDSGPGVPSYTTGGTPAYAYNVTTGTWKFVSPFNSVDQGSDADTLAVFASTGVYISTDFGDSWDRHKPDTAEDTNWVLGVTDDGADYVIAIDDSDNIYRTANGGSSWAAIDPADGDTFAPTDIDASDNMQYVIIVGTNSTDSTRTAFLSEDYGATWTAINPTISGGNYNWTECQISNTGLLIGLARSGAIYMSWNGGDTWEGQSLPTSGSTWEDFAISGDGKVGIITNTAADNEWFVNSGWYRKPIISEASITSTGLSILDDASTSDVADTLGLGTGDSPEFTGLTLSGLSASSIVATDGSSALTVLADPLIVGHGGTGASTLTDHGILLGSGTGAITPLGSATNGQLPIGSTGADPVLATISGTANQIAVTNAAGSITLALTGNMDEIAALTPTDGNFLVGNGSTWVAESGATARTSLGCVDPDDTPLISNIVCMNNAVVCYKNEIVVRS